MTDKTNDAIPRAWIVQADNGGPKMFMLEPEAPTFEHVSGAPAAPAAAPGESSSTGVEKDSPAPSSPSKQGA
jgi:hypothetical protein